VTDARRQVGHQAGQYFGRGVAVLPYMLTLSPGSNDCYAFSASSAASTNNSHRQLSLEKYRNFQALAICALFARGFADTWMTLVLQWRILHIIEYVIELMTIKGAGFKANPVRSIGVKAFL
jgi:hypothetical protein